MFKMISIIMPAYNEEKNLAANMPVLQRYLAANFKDHEVIVVDDGSKDRTRHVAERFAQKDNNVKIISYGKNMGRGYAVREGMKRARSKNIFMMDADMPSSVNMGIVRKMVDGLKTNDLVIASRFIEGSRIKRKTHRAILSIVYRKFVRMIFPRLKVSDTDSGLKAFSKDVSISLAENTEENRWSWDLEAIVFARKGGLKIKELPLEWKEDGGSTVNLFISPFEQLLGAMNIRMKYGRI